jgi:hypothetical protein
MWCDVLIQNLDRHELFSSSERRRLRRAMHWDAAAKARIELSICAQERVHVLETE